jgi:hypothetical protein
VLRGIQEEVRRLRRRQLVRVGGSRNLLRRVPGEAESWKASPHIRERGELEESEGQFAKV